MAAFAALAFGPTQGSALALFIDEFTTPQRVTDNPVGSIPNNSQVVAPDALGGFREMHVETFGPDEADTNFQVAAGTLSFSNNTSVTGRAWLTYDGDYVGVAEDPTDVLTTGLGGIDFLIGPSPFLNFDVVSFESNLLVEIEAWDMFGNNAFYDEILPPAGAFSPILPLTDFALTGAFDWTQVGALQFRVESLTVGYDGSLDAISVNSVPLPATALLLLGGVGALAWRRRKA